MTNMTHPPTVREPGEGKTIAVVGDVYRFLATGDETDGRCAMFEAVVRPGGGPPPHIHSREEESFYVLEGEITFQVGDQQFVAKAGTFANMPVGSLHSFENNTNKQARMIISVAPAGLESMFYGDRPAGCLRPAGPARSKAEIDKLLAVTPATASRSNCRSTEACEELRRGYMGRSPKQEGGVHRKSTSNKTPFPKGLAQPALRALASAGYDHMEQLAGVPESEVRELHGIGPHALRKLRDAMSTLGLSFATSESADTTAVPSNFADLWCEDRGRQGAAFQQILDQTSQPVDWTYDVWDELLAQTRDKQPQPLHSRTGFVQSGEERSIEANVARLSGVVRCGHR